MEFGERLKQLRKEKHLSQQELGKKLNVSGSMIGQYENGLRNPKHKTILKIAAALDVDADQLVCSSTFFDRDYEKICEVLNAADLSIAPTGYGSGADEAGDLYYIWHTDDPFPEGPRIELEYRQLASIIKAAERSAELKRYEFLKARLEADLFL